MRRQRSESCLVHHKTSSNVLLSFIFRAKGQLIYWVYYVFLFKKVDLLLIQGLELVVF